MTGIQTGINDKYMNQQSNMEERLWDYIDSTSNVEEKQFIEEMIRTDMEWKKKYDALLEAHQLMQQHLELDEPSMRFSMNVMEEIAKHHIAPATRSYINKNIIRGIAAFFIVMFLGMIVYGFSQANWSSAGSGIALTWDLDKFDWNKYLNSTYTNIFIMINIVLGLMLLDMYLSKKKREHLNSK